MNPIHGKIILMSMVVLILFAFAPVHADPTDDLFDRGKAYQKAGKYTEALDLYNQVLVVRPTDSDVLYRKYEVLEKLGHLDEAHETNVLAMLYAPNMTDPTYYFYWSDGSSGVCREYANRGVDYLDWGQYENALFQFNRVHEICPNDTNTLIIYCNEGFALYKLGRYDEAIAAYDNAIRTGNKYEKNVVHATVDREKVMRTMAGNVSTATVSVTLQKTEVPQSGNETGVPVTTQKAPFSLLVSLLSLGLAVLVIRKH